MHASPSHLEFELELARHTDPSATDVATYVASVRSPAGEAEGHFRLPFRPEESQAELRRSAPTRKHASLSLMRKGTEPMKAKNHSLLRYLRAFGWRKLGLALAALITVCAGCGNAPAPNTAVAVADPARDVAPATLDDPPPAALGVMPACQGEAFEVDMLDALAVLPDDTLEAQREQVRDWLWHVTLARSSQKPAVDNAFSGIADEPLFRDDAIGHVLTLPTGSARATTTKGGEVIVLVDALNEPHLSDRVLEAVDEQALGLGRTPSKVKVFGFELEQDTAIAKVCLIEERDTAALENQGAGFKRASVTSLPELEQFLAGGIDLLSAECKTEGLVLSGRQRPRDAGAPITAEHIAALAQQLNDEYIPPERFGTSLAARSTKERVQYVLDAEKLDQMTRPFGLYNQDLAADKFTARAVEWKRLNRSVNSANVLLSASLQDALDGKPGFSLDPEFTKREILARVDELAAAMTDSKSLVKKLREWGAPALATAAFSGSDAELATLRAQLQEARSTLSEGDEDDVLATLWKISSGDSALAPLATELRVSGGKQCARYDGPLAGTEAGMTFFYTDVAAKFFARDFDRRSPEGNVPGFESVVDAVGSGAWCSEPRRPGTRIWFGLRDEGYARESRDGVRFGPTTTRLFAKGSPEPGSAEKETEPNASYGRFIRWWDAHYGAIASWEPQYELLNQLMKWSVVTQQARLSGKSKCGEVLRAASFGTEARLATWSAARPALRWADALKQFHATESGRECLPIIRSEAFAACGGAAELQGGVSAGSLEQVQTKAIRAASSPRWLSRLAGGAEPELKGDRAVFSKLERSGGGKLKDVEILGTPEKIRFFAKVDPSARQIGSVALFTKDFPVTSFEKVVERHGATLSGTENLNGLLRAGLTVYDLNLPRARLSVRSGPVVVAESLAQKVVSKMTHARLSLEDAAAAVHGPSDAHLVGKSVAYELTDGSKSPKLAIMSSGGGVRGPPADLAFSVGGPDGGRLGDYLPAPSPRSVEVRIVDQAAAKRFFGDAANVPLKSATKHDGLVQSVEQALTAGKVADASAALRPALHGLDLESLSRLNRVLEKARVEAARKGNADELARLEFSVAMAARKLAPPEPRIAQELRGATRLIAPVDFPTEASAPPIIYPRHKILKPGEHYVSRVISMPEALAHATTFEDAAGDSFKVRALNPGASRGGERIGAGLRLAGTTRTAVVIVKCSDVDSSLPRCTVPAAQDEQLMSMLNVAMECSKLERDNAADDDEAKITATIKSCSQAAEQCDTDHDEALTSQSELACMRDVVKKMANTAPPSPQ